MWWLHPDCFQFARRWQVTAYNLTEVYGIASKYDLRCITWILESSESAALLAVLPLDLVFQEKIKAEPESKIRHIPARIFT